MRILLLSQYCWPEIDHKCLPLAKEIKKAGHQVEILTGYPNRPTGKLYPGYKYKLYHKEIIDGIIINRVPSYLNHTNSSTKRLISFITFAFSASIIGQFLIKKPDLIFAYHAPGTIAIPAIYLKYRFRSKIFYDINDYWPDTLIELGKLNNKILISLIKIYCKISYIFFDKINVVSNGFKKKLLELKIPQHKISLIYNWSLPMDNIQSSYFNKYKEIFNNNFTIMYAGNIGIAQNLSIIIDAAEKIKSNGVNGIKFFIVGSGIEKSMLENEVIRRELGQFVFFTGFIHPDNVGQFLENASILFLHLKKIPLFNITIPSKLVSYFIYSKPLLCGVAGETAEIVSNSKSGYCFEPENVEDLYNKILLMIDLDDSHLIQMGKSGRSNYDLLFSFESGTKKMINEFEKMVNN